MPFYCPHCKFGTYSANAYKEHISSSYHESRQWPERWLPMPVIDKDNLLPEGLLEIDPNIIKRDMKKHTCAWHCSLCGVSSTDKLSIELHFGGSKHIKMQNMFYAENEICMKTIAPRTKINKLQPVLMETKATPEIKPAKESSEFVPKELGKSIIAVGDSYHCICCDAPINGILAMNEHVSGKVHKKRYAAYMARMPATVVDCPDIPFLIENDKLIFNCELPREWAEFGSAETTMVLDYFWGQSVAEKCRPPMTVTKEDKFIAEIDLTAAIGEAIKGAKGLPWIMFVVCRSNGESTKKAAQRHATTIANYVLDRFGLLGRALPDRIQYPGRTQ